ncbi:hypothetical protein [Metabacillus schmidteae]|uniref:hypothetical protein n=1 Tax=Metabacillus schmidteae TaxID=2730405 RepID=UPI00158C6731|nr:hypothetical protein [Metabacillus schmidteae]
MAKKEIFFKNPQRENFSYLIQQYYNNEMNKKTRVYSSLNITKLKGGLGFVHTADQK